MYSKRRARFAGGVGAASNRGDFFAPPGGRRGSTREISTYWTSPFFFNWADRRRQTQMTEEIE
jgi:hypothetical protein